MNTNLNTGPMLRALFALLATLWVSSPSWAVDPSPGRAQELVHMVREDCGSCHGLTLKGGLGPSLLPQALRGKPAGSLRDTILNGRPGTAMPPWKHFMNEAEADWVVRQLLHGFPEEAK